MPFAGRLDPDELDPGVEEREEDAHGVRSAADAGDDDIGLEVSQVGRRLLADHLLELPNHERERMRADHRADDVVGGLDGADPVAHRFLRRRLSRCRLRS